ncbi:hypothetical protein C8F04DRAFT_1063572 [Mycena alexandri]|uniref:Uncharacterized protein n=1 Tax=Mycena alexandri TaxID=1745969 RepID=A0AAD6XDN9_9AGAR|nr:hypothetical protein C8F04DRAFT_1063572 [Mycena alexandri]
MLITTGRLRRGRRRLLLSVRARPLRHTGSTSTFRRRRARWRGTRRSMRCRWRTIPFQFAASPAAARAAPADAPPDADAVFGLHGHRSPYGVQQTHQQQHSHSTTSLPDGRRRTSISKGAGIAQQVGFSSLLPFVFAWSSILTSSDSHSHSRQNGAERHARTVSYSLNSDSCSSDDEGGLDEDEEMADVEGEMADDWEGGESDEDDGDDASARWCPPWRVGTGAGTRAVPSSHPQRLAPHQQFLQSSQQNGLGLVPPTHHSVISPQNYGAPARRGVHAGLPARLPHSQSHSHDSHMQLTDARGAEQ